jgi:hypothetical protein
MRRVAFIALASTLLLPGIQLYAQSNMALEKVLAAKEQVGWQAWKDHNAKLIEGMIPDDAIDIADGATLKGKQKIMDATNSPTCTVNSFSLSDFSYQWLDKDLVMITYTAEQDATCSGKKQPGKVLAASLWQKKGGQWISPFHQETAVEGM